MQQLPPMGSPAGNEPLTSSERKRRAILAAAEELFLDAGYLGTSMDEVAARAKVSKQTVYAHAGSKEALFVALVSAMTTGAGDAVHAWDGAEPAVDDDVERYLREYAERQLAVVLTPRLLRLRRLVIGEVARFPDLARALYEAGPQRAIAAMAGAFERLTARGLLDVADPVEAATTFNWLIMGGPVNEAMLLGDDAILAPSRRRAHARHVVQVFLAAYGVR
ncbi:TetR/AcrR family transcriptional regulator [Georgenia sp. MJ173]|uniref:TetR/AcrR family transcriptional regulator n=1 Tax=Georgenia sunbinii TaxID=3117728 RepID=UPI002F2624FB